MFSVQPYEAVFIACRHLRLLKRFTAVPTSASSNGLMCIEGIRSVRLITFIIAGSASCLVAFIKRLKASNLPVTCRIAAK